MKNVIGYIKQLLGLFYSENNMGIRLGNFDPLQLIFGIMDSLLRSGHITIEQARKILKDSLPPEMSDDEKNRIVDSMIIRTPQ